MHYLPQTSEKTEADRKEEIENYLKTAMEYYSGEMQAAKNFESEETKNLILQMTGASESVIVGDKQTLRNSLLKMNFRVKMLRCWMRAEPL